MNDYTRHHYRNDPHYGRGRGGRGYEDDEDTFSPDNMNHTAKDAFKQGADALMNAELGKTKKVFGVFDVDAGIAAWISTIYNVATDYASQTVAPKAGELVEKFGPKILGGKFGKNPAVIKNAAAAANIGSTLFLKTGGYFGDIWNTYSGQRHERAQLARTLAPVLDSIKGNHSVGALYSVTQEENEVIFAHRKRLAKIASTHNISNWVDLAVNSGPNLVLDGKRFKKIWAEKRNVTEYEMHQLAHAQQLQAAGEVSQGKHMLGLMVNATAPQLAERLHKSGEHKLNTTLQPYSALEMILELNEQAASKPDAHRFQMPRSFNGKGYREECSLEEYLMRICIQHQKDMADINPQHSEIREALREDLAAAVKPIAAAIRNGDISPMSLVRMVGEGRIVKKHGRAIASPKDVKDLVSKEAPKQASFAQVDTADYYRDAAFNRDQLKVALKTLNGDEKLTFAAMFPDSVLAEVGMSKKEIKEMREATIKHYERTLGEAMMGLNAQTDDQLKAEGLAQNEIEDVRTAAKQIEENGEKAVHDLKASAANEYRGVEQKLTNVIVHQPEYLGKLLKTGREQFAAVSANQGGYAARERDATNDDQYLGAANGR